MKPQMLIIFLLVAVVSGHAQQDVSVLNKYKYVYLTSGNVPPFMRFSIYDDVSEKLKECGMKIIKRNEKLQISDTCSIVFCELQSFLLSLQSDVRLYFTDCNGQPVFISKTGYSGVFLKGTKWGYELATAEALQSLKGFQYVYRQ